MKAPELVVLSRDRAEQYTPRGVEICISITDPGAREVLLSSDFAGVLRLQFSDIAGQSWRDEILFAPSHAREIVEFVRRWPQAERIVLHCTAGMSRSPGVALGLCDLNGWPTEAIEGAKPFWNTLVRSVLAAERGDERDAAR